MGDVFYVYASIGQSGSERLFSAFVNGMYERKTCAVVRFIKKGFTSSKSGTHVMPDPQVGILFPATDEETKSEYCYYIRVSPLKCPSESSRTDSIATCYSYPSEKIFALPGSLRFPTCSTEKGEPISSHPLLPTKAQDQAMDDFVDSMDLGKVAQVDEDG